MVLVCLFDGLPVVEADLGAPGFYLIANTGPIRMRRNVPGTLQGAPARDEPTAYLVRS
jgi:hypothetical protein